MITFNEWLDHFNEAQTAGAFGKTGVQKPRYNVNPSLTQNAPPDTFTPTLRTIGNYNHGREQQNTLKNYDQRIAFGLTQEQKILQAARDAGLDVRPSSEEDDKNGFIDGYWKVGMQLIPIQIKYRDNGDDLLFEVIKPFKGMPLLSLQNRLGRDVKPARQPATSMEVQPNYGAKYIFFLNRAGNKLYIIESKPCYKLIYDMMVKVDKSGWNMGNSLVTSAGVLRQQKDNSSGVPKIMAYLPLHTLNIVKQYDVNVKIG